MFYKSSTCCVSSCESLGKEGTSFVITMGLSLRVKTEPKMILKKVLTLLHLVNYSSLGFLEHFLLTYIICITLHSKAFYSLIRDIFILCSLCARIKIEKCPYSQRTSNLTGRKKHKQDKAWKKPHMLRVILLLIKNNNNIKNHGPF